LLFPCQSRLALSARCRQHAGGDSLLPTRCPRRPDAALVPV